MHGHHAAYDFVGRLNLKMMLRPLLGCFFFQRMSCSCSGNLTEGGDSKSARALCNLAVVLVGRPGILN
jgi:hypothetical protein